MSTKKCARCNETKELSAFGSYNDNRNNKTVNRKYAYCKACALEYKRTDNKEGSAKSRKKSYDKDPETQRIRSRETNRSIRQKAITLYGSICAMCGVSEFDVLTIDHIHGGGRKHSKESGGCIPMYRQILDEYRPDLYRVLCYNCNCGKRVYENAQSYTGAKRINFDYMQRKRFKLLQEYGGCCVQCGITDLQVLTFDHSLNDGALDRTLHGSGSRFIHYLARTEKRKDIQILCWNCNCKKGKHTVSTRISRERKADTGHNPIPR